MAFQTIILTNYKVTADWSEGQFSTVLAYCLSVMSLEEGGGCPPYMTSHTLA